MQPHSHDPVEHIGEQSCRIWLLGEIDAFTAPTLTEQLRSLPVGVDVEVDVSRVRFMSAAGVTLLLVLREQIVQGGACLRLMGVPAAVDRVLALVGVRDLFVGASGDPADGAVEPSTVVTDLRIWAASRSSRPERALAPPWLVADTDLPRPAYGRLGCFDEYAGDAPAGSDAPDGRRARRVGVVRTGEGSDQDVV